MRSGWEIYEKKGVYGLFWRWPNLMNEYYFREMELPRRMEEIKGWEKRPDRNRKFS